MAVQTEDDNEAEQKFSVPFNENTDVLNFLQDIEAAEQQIDEISNYLEYEKTLVVENLDESKFGVKIYVALSKPEGQYRRTQ